MRFSVTYYLELHAPIFCIINVLFYQVKKLVFDDVHTTNLTMVGKN
jgi:hypothetical protein